VVPPRSAAILAAVLSLGTPQPGTAQWAIPPSDGGLVASLGQPIRWRWGVGISSGAWFEGPGSSLLVRAGVGTYHDLLSPDLGLAQVGAEGFIGFRDADLDGGLRAIFRIPVIGLGAGGEYDFLDAHLNFVVTAQTPVVRGGLLAAGGVLRINWYPTESSSFTVGLAVPIGDRRTGRGRPASEYAASATRFETPRPYELNDPAIDAALDSMRASAEWIRRVTAPFLDQDGRDWAIAQKRNDDYLESLRVHLAERSADDEVRFFHAELNRAFGLAARNDSVGRALTRTARDILLYDVILPYNRLLGMKQQRDALQDLVVIARGRFGGSVAASGLAPGDRTARVLYVFQQLTAILETERTVTAREWNDPRLVWLPLQYALLPEQHDTQAELDALVDSATGVQFTDGNRIRYLANLQFHWELLASVRAAKRYHVLLIHDFPAVTPADLVDSASFNQVLGYLNTLAEKVEAYDSTRTLPTYFIFLDQHYYEARHGRTWMDILQDPLHASPHVPHATPAQAESLGLALGRLRTAVGRSAVLEAEARQFGERWLENRVKVQVNITNQADETYWSGGLVSSFFAYPDNLMRDHRKVAFYDVGEADPWSGRAIYSGSGVGQQYLGRQWEDRSIIVEGPVLLELKRAVRELLVAQGMPANQIPLEFRARPRSAQYDSLLAAGPGDSTRGARALQLSNGTGFQPKPIDVGKALLYSLMPRGSVIKIPDSLWNSFFYGGLLAGACLRGATVVIIAPARPNAPSAGWPQLIREWELLTRLLAVREALAVPIAAAGGMLQLGLYAIPPDSNGLASRVRIWNENVAQTPFLRELMPFLPPVWPVEGPIVPSTTAPDTAAPKLHLKVQFLGTRPMWNAIVSASEWPEFMAGYLTYREATYSADKDATCAASLPAELQEIAQRIYQRTRKVDGAAEYVLMGSQNQDYRGMFMDGEVDLLFSGAETLVPLVDMIFIEGTATWLTTQESLDKLLRPPGAYKRRVARVFKDGV
jgi:hypothetical protein